MPDRTQVLEHLDRLIHRCDALARDPSARGRARLRTVAATYRESGSESLSDDDVCNALQDLYLELEHAFDLSSPATRRRHRATVEDMKTAEKIVVEWGDRFTRNDGDVALPGEW